MGRIESNITYFATCAAAVASLALVQKYRGIQSHIPSSRITPLSLSAIALQVATDPKVIRGDLRKYAITTLLLPVIATSTFLHLFEKTAMKTSLASGIKCGLGLTALKIITDWLTEDYLDHFVEMLLSDPNDINVLDNLIGYNNGTLFLKRPIPIEALVSYTIANAHNDLGWKLIADTLPNGQTASINSKEWTKEECEHQAEVQQLLPNTYYRNDPQSIERWKQIAEKLNDGQVVYIDNQVHYTKEQCQRKVSILGSVDKLNKNMTDIEAWRTLDQELEKRNPAQTKVEFSGGRRFSREDCQREIQILEAAGKVVESATSENWRKLGAALKSWGEANPTSRGFLGLRYVNIGGVDYDFTACQKKAESIDSSK